ncbi:MAG: AAA family ATPase [Hyphomicrobiales bacterium]|nr:AAA family ATPase [Hyphomicrobiales bacterium]MCP5001474.1 AAA family ATPase [Hyphomicrobiales bacterium]
MANPENFPAAQTQRPAPLPDALREKGLAGRGDVEGQRRQVTVLFADVVGYTLLAQELGDEQIFLFMQRVIRELSEAVHLEEGTVQELTGDGLMALFGAPLAFEDGPVRACRAALEIQARMRRIGDQVAGDHNTRPQLRIGVHTGPVVVGKVGDDLHMELTALGDTVNLASRLEGAAESGEVLISEATHALVGDFVECRPAGTRELKGFRGPISVYRLDGLKSDISRFDVAVKRGLTPLVGRHRELEQLQVAWRKAKARSIRVVNVVGEPGIGKSRLVHEFRVLAENDDALFVQGYCAAGSRAALFRPFIEVVRGAFRISERSDQATTTKALRAGLELLGLPDKPHLPYLLNLLGHEAGDIIDRMGRDVVRHLTLETLQKVLFERCRTAPMVLCLEDLHWIDPASREFLQWLATATDEIPVLVLCTYRPEHIPTWAQGNHIAQIVLEPLSGEGTLNLVKRRLGVDNLPNELAGLLATKSEGNPLFAEEITSYLIKTEQVLVDKGHLKFQAENKKSSAAGVPETLGGLLMQRVDRLDGDTRRVLDAAAVVGTRFGRDLVGEVTGLGSSLSPHLEVLEREDLIFQENSGDRSRFRIKHALVQDAVYDCLLSGDRQALHLAVARAMEMLYAGRESEVVDLLADHYERTSKTDKAVYYLVLAGERAYRTYSIPEADKRYHQALRLIEADPDKIEPPQQIDLVLDLARLYYFKSEIGKLIDIVERYLPMAETLGDRIRLSHCLSELGYARVFAGEGEAGKPLLKQALSMAMEVDNKGAIAHASAGLAWYYGFVAEASSEQRAALREYGEQAFEFGQEINDFWLAAKGLYATSAAVLLEGNPGETRDIAKRLLAYSQTCDHPWPRMMAIDLLSIMDEFTGDYQGSLEKAEESVRSINDPVALHIMALRKASALARLGRTREACEQFAKTRAILFDNRFLLPLSVSDYLYGLALVLDGNFAVGVNQIEEHRRRLPDWDFPRIARFADYFLGQVFLAMALGKERPPISVVLRNIWFLLRNGPAATRKARRYLRNAEKVFREREAPSFLADTLIGLARLALKEKRFEEAHSLIEEAHTLAHSVQAARIVETIDEELRAL